MGGGTCDASVHRLPAPAGGAAMVARQDMDALLQLRAAAAAIPRGSPLQQWARNGSDPCARPHRWKGAFCWQRFVGALSAPVRRRAGGREWSILMYGGSYAGKDKRSGRAGVDAR